MTAALVQVVGAIARVLARVVHVLELVTTLGTDDEVVVKKLDERATVIAGRAVFDDVDAHVTKYDKGVLRPTAADSNGVTPLGHGGNMFNSPLPNAQQPLIISCDTCVMQDTSACDDCIVPMLCGEVQSDAVIFDYEELRTLAVLAKGGLVPRLRHQRSA